MSERSRNWMGTLNNPSVHVEQWTTGEEFLRQIKEKHELVYVCGQLEKGADGTVHVQYYINISKA